MPRSEDTSRRIQAALDVVNETLFGRRVKRRRSNCKAVAEPMTAAEHLRMAERWDKAAAKHDAAGKSSHANLARRAAAQHRVDAKANEENP